MARHGTEKLLGAVAVSAIQEMAKMNSKFPVTGATFDPFREDSQDFALRYGRKSAPKAKPVPTGTYPHPAKDMPEEDTEGPTPEERLHVPEAPAAPKRAARSLLSGLNARSLRQAVVLSEILAPPVSLRRK